MNEKEGEKFTIPYYGWKKRKKRKATPTPKDVVDRSTKRINRELDECWDEEAQEHNP